MSRLNSSLTLPSRVSTGASRRDVARTKMASARQPRTRDMENFLIVWLNFTLNQFDSNSFDKLQQILNSIKKFINPDLCLDYVKQIKDEQVFLIINGSTIDEKRMSQYDELSAIHSIYFLSEEKFPSCDRWKKFKGIFKNIDQICDALKRELHQSENDLTPISLISSESIRHLHQLDQSFMYAQLIKEILLERTFTKDDQDEFVQYSRIQYADNRYELEIIEQFELTYDRSEAIKWYNRRCFTNYMLNKALRTQDTEVIIKMGFFIRDLHDQIEERHGQSGISTVYRGQRILNLEFNKLLRSKGGLLSFNNFVSTRLDRQSAFDSLEQSRLNSQVTSILFQIQVSPSNSFVLTRSSDNEDEVLFSLHTIFRIDEVKSIDERLWQVNLTSPSTNDEQVQRLTNYTKQVTREEIGMHRMAKLMLVIDQIEKAEEIYSALLETTDDDDEKELAYLHHQLGYINEQKGHLSDALAHYEQSLEYHLCYLPLDDPQLCPTYSNLGLILKKQGNLDRAFEYFQQALDISLIAFNRDQLEIAIRYNHLGGVLDAQGQSTKALENYQHALDIELEHLSAHHPLIGATHNNIGLVYYSIADYSSALTHFLKTLDIEEKSLSQDHPSLIMTYANLAGVLENLHQYQQAIDYIEKALKIARQAFSLDHPQVQVWQEYLRQLREKQFDHL